MWRIRCFSVAGWASIRRPRRGTGEGSMWPVLAPTVLVLALLLLATAYAGAFDVAEWAPPTLFILLMLLTLLRARRRAAAAGSMARAGARGRLGTGRPGRRCRRPGRRPPGAALEGAGRQAMYAAILTLPLVAVGDLRSLRVAARGVVGGIALIALYTLARMLDRRAVDLPGGQAQRAGRIPQRDRPAVLHRLLAADRDRRHARAGARSARRLPRPGRADAGARLPHAVARGR